MSLIRILGHVISRGIAGELEKMQQRAVEKAKATVCCADCETVLARDSRACHSCGSRNLSSEHEIIERKKRIEDLARIEAESSMAVRMQEQMIAAHEKQRERDFKTRKKSLRSGLVCTSCNLLYDSSHKFCPSCANKTVKLEPERIEAILFEEYPERFRDTD